MPQIKSLVRLPLRYEPVSSQNPLTVGSGGAAGSSERTIPAFVWIQTPGGIGDHRCHPSRKYRFRASRCRFAFHRLRLFMMFWWVGAESNRRLSA